MCVPMHGRHDNAILLREEGIEGTGLCHSVLL